MNRRQWLLAWLGLAVAGNAFALEDPGKAEIGQVRVAVYYATDGDPSVAGKNAKPVSQDVADRLRKEERLRFKNYRLLGEDTQALLRSYESWAEPLKPSDEIMVRFEAQGAPTKKTASLDLELWLSRKKTVKTYARLEGDRPLFVLGPQWRGGRLIIAVALAQKPKSGS
jgi:hypothetical protein